MPKNLVIRLTLMVLMIHLTACAATGTGPTNPSPTAPVVTDAQATARPKATTATATAAKTPTRGVMPSAQIQPVAGSYLFTEGPAPDSQGNVYFSDINAGKIYRWSPDGQVSVFVDGLKGPNGLAFDKNGLLVACEGGNGRVISIDPQGKINVLADQYNGVRFNEPNDLWIDAQGGIYFTDPAYNAPAVQEGEDVYYLAPDKRVTRVIQDMVRPNGIVGAQDGKTLYVADHGAGNTYVYSIDNPGRLSNKRLFAATGSDGMELDAQGNLYLTTGNTVRVYDAAGKQLRDIAITESPTNVTFAGKDEEILFITARTAVYTLQMGPSEANTANASATVSNLSGFRLTSSDISEGGALPAEYTCDGAANTLALSWKGAPAETQSFAVVMHHEASPTDIHWYWVIYDIPVRVTGLPKNMTGTGTLGNNSVNGKTAYAPPCSKGPGAKTYIYTVYALSAPPQIAVPTDQVTRAVLLDAIQDITLASAELHVTYTRP